MVETLTRLNKIGRITLPWLYVSVTMLTVIAGMGMVYATTGNIRISRFIFTCKIFIRCAWGDVHFIFQINFGTGKINVNIFTQNHGVSVVKILRQ